MKNTTKIIIVIVLALTLTFTLCACLPKVDEIYELPDTLLALNYPSFSVKVTTAYSPITGGTTDPTVLVSTFNVQNGETSTTVSYSIQSRSTFTFLNPTTVEIPDEPITTVRGTATVVDGKVNGQVPDDVDLSGIADVNFSFAKKLFDNVVESENGFSATIVDPYAFLHNNSTPFADNSARLTVVYDDFVSQINKISISYSTLNGFDITIEYEFGAIQ